MPLHIFPSRFSSSNTGLQGAKSFARDRNGLRISACASPICAEVLAGEILKALGGIKEISLRNASVHPRGFAPSFIFTPRDPYAAGGRDACNIRGTAGQAIYFRINQGFPEDEGKHSTKTFIL